MNPNTCLLLGLLIFRVGKVTKSGRWAAGHETQKLKSPHNSSIFLTLQSTGETMTSLCMRSWCGKVDDVFVVPHHANWHKNTEQWVIEHFEKLFYHSQRAPQHAEWYMFAFDDNYMFIDRLITDLSFFDSHLPIYTILRDPKAQFHHKPVVVFSRFALNSFFEQAQDKCDGNLDSFEEWLSSCMSVPPINISLDKSDKSRVFAIKRHFQPFEYEMNQENYQDDKEFISSHSGSLLSFTNLDETDLKLLPVFVEKVTSGRKQRR